MWDARIPIRTKAECPPPPTRWRERPRPCAIGHTRELQSRTGHVAVRHPGLEHASNLTLKSFAAVEPPQLADDVSTDVRHLRADPRALESCRHPAAGRPPRVMRFGDSAELSAACELAKSLGQLSHHGQDRFSLLGAVALRRMQRPLLTQSGLLSSTLPIAEYRMRFHHASDADLYADVDTQPPDRAVGTSP